MALEDVRREIDEAFQRWCEQQWDAWIDDQVAQIRRGYTFTNSASFTESELVIPSKKS